MLHLADEHASRIAAAVGPAARVVVSCRQASAFVPAMLGSWLAGATVELLPNVQAGTLDRVDADPEIAAVLHDDPARQQRSPKAIYVPALASGPAAAPPARPLPVTAVRMTTSGTTERPRYIAKSMAQLTAEVEVLATVIPPARCVLSTVPLSHLYGLLWGALLPLRIGARIISHDALLPADVAAVIEREGVDLVISTPAHLRAMASAKMPRNLRVISSGARLAPELHASLVATHGWDVIDVLGSTEAGGIATRHAPTAAWKPLPGVTLAEGDDHRLVVQSPWSDGRLEVEDRVELHADGTFEHLGRTQELIKIAGKRADARAIEATVLAIPGIREVAVTVHAAGGQEPRVALAFAVEPGAQVGREAIVAAIRAQFDAVFVPRAIRQVARIPRTDRGKIDLPKLQELFAATVDRIPVQRVAPGRYEADIPRDLVFFRGHFDAFSILPGAVIVERLVWPIVTAELPEVTALKGIRRLRFRRPVLPEQHLAVTVERAADRVMFSVLSEAEVVATGQLLVE